MIEAIVGRLENVRKHPNADRLYLAEVFGIQIITGSEAKNGDLVVYFPSDSQLSDKYLMHNQLYRKHPETGEAMGGYIENNRRVRIIKLRGEISDGLIMPVESLDFIEGFDANDFFPGYTFTVYRGHEVVRKYVKESISSVVGGGVVANNVSLQEQRYPFFSKVGDTKKFTYYLDQIKAGSVVVITEKLHGTSGRTTLTVRKNVAEKPKTWYNKVLAFLRDLLSRETGPSPVVWDAVTGTRHIIIDDKHPDKYRVMIHKWLSGLLRKGETVYYEIVGFADQTPIMPRYSTNKFPELKKQYGDVITFSYGNTPGRPTEDNSYGNTPGRLTGNNTIYVYRITLTNEDGASYELSWDQVVKWCNHRGLNHVPVLDCFVYDGNPKALLERVKMLSDGPSVLDPTHIREGVCVRVGDTVYKYKGESFCLLEDIAKEKSDYEDVS